ncbi:MAG: DegT/DnrJ/EryC1/StrS aminotransferase family protein, partial [Nitrospirae bacterium]|nr:DegT/DnrJ/EryC1/StrS aminotransferase family protein [Nitrospirota bacterium]
FAERYGLPRGVATSRARMALYYLLKNMGLKPNGEVLISAIHVADFINIIALAGFKPVVVDLAHNSYNVDCDDLERKITKNSVLFLMTYLSGYVPDMERIVEISQKYKLPFIEDCSQALDSYYKGQRLGTFGVAAIFSLSLFKSVTTLFGGMLISRNETLLSDIRQDVKSLKPPPKQLLVNEAIKNVVLKIVISNPLFSAVVFPLMRWTLPVADYFSKYQKSNKQVFLRDKIPDEFLVQYTWQQAITGLSQLKTLDKRERKRKENALYLYDNIVSDRNVAVPALVKDSENSFWLFPVIVNSPNEFRAFLAKTAIDSSKFLLSLLCEEKVFSHFKFNSDNARELKQKTVFVPMYSVLSKAQTERIAQAIKKYQAINGSNNDNR